MVNPNKWHYPVDIAQDLEHVPLPTAIKAEVLACAWEYSRCVIPQYTNWKRYVAWCRIIIIGVIAEFRGEMVDMVADGRNVLGYDLDHILDELFGGTNFHEAMSREYRMFLLITSEKTSDRQHGALFQRYRLALASSPRNWFRLRDCDALARFSAAAALACNDIDKTTFDEAQWQVLAEIGVTLYDAIAFYKHRAEGETNSTFAYMPTEMRQDAYRVARETLWALDVAGAQQPEHIVVHNFLRFFGGPIHMMMRRYRFVEEDLTIGRPETKTVVQATRENFKLWNLLEMNAKNADTTIEQRYRSVLAKAGELTFDGFVGILEGVEESRACEDCGLWAAMVADSSHRFSGQVLCGEHRREWGEYLADLPLRVSKAFPMVSLTGCRPTK